MAYITLMRSAIQLEKLLQPIGVQDSAGLSQRINSRDMSVHAAIGVEGIRKLTGVAGAAFNYYWDRFESGDGVANLARFGWLMVELGRYFRDIQYREKAKIALFEAWNTFIDHEARGHANTSHELAREYPELLEITDVQEYYQKNPEVAKAYGIVVP